MFSDEVELIKFVESCFLHLYFFRVQRVFFLFKSILNNPFKIRSVSIKTWFPDFIPSPISPASSPDSRVVLFYFLSSKRMTSLSIPNPCFSPAFFPTAIPKHCIFYANHQSSSPALPSLPHLAREFPV